MNGTLKLGLTVAAAIAALYAVAYTITEIIVKFTKED
jgi:hypothetical protein